KHGGRPEVTRYNGRHFLYRVLSKPTWGFARKQRVGSFRERKNVRSRRQMIVTGGNRFQIQRSGLDERVVLRRRIDVGADAGYGAFVSRQPGHPEISNLHDLAISS